ncbi:MAG: SPOR domain-containing protein [Bacteroidia bacterium]
MKWFLYISALGAFIWYVFLRDIDSKASQTSAENQEEVLENQLSEPEEVEEEYVTEKQKAFIEDTTSETITEEVISEEVPEAVETTTEEKPLENAAINLSDKYLVVVGSFGNKSNADRMLKKVQDQGFDGVITKINGLHRVVVSSSNSEEDAERTNKEFPEAGFVLAQ